MEFGLLGPFTVCDGPDVVTLGGPRQRTVLAHLVLRANREVTRDQLIDLVWGERPPASARATLHSYVSRLRGVLGPDRILAHGHAYVLRADPDEVDAARFEVLEDGARRQATVDPAEAAATYRQALRLWRGPALQDLAAEPSLQPEIVRLDGLRLIATEDWVATELALGRHRDVISDLEAFTTQHPYRERLWGQLMVALYRDGQQQAALAAYTRARTVLVDDLGLDPWPELVRLHQQVVRQDPALDTLGQPLRGYRLIERVGQGTFGTVHRALQPEVGREVAVKVIRAELANDPEFVRRFAAEAQRVARLEHPHIVPLHDYWREPDGAYLVMRHLRGGSLRDVLAEGPLPPERVARLVEQVGLALAFAHRQGVVHRDVKPANILFDEEGNAYLSDFGIARETATGDGRSALHLPSPLAAYVSPEEGTGGPVDARTDVYSLGVLAFEALSGRHPFADTPVESLADAHVHEPMPSLRRWLPDVPEAVDRVLARATAKAVEERPKDPAAVAAELRRALAPLIGRALDAHDPAVTRARNPYKGLRPFQEADADDFHGRRRMVGELVRKLSQPAGRFLAVVGPSGSGKSSLVRAGLVPALRRGALPGSERWLVAEMFPGEQPYDELAAALTRVAAIPQPGLLGRLQRDVDGLIRAAGELLPCPDSELLLVVDQFEEVFTICADDQRTPFLRSLAAAVTDPGSRVRIVVTVRADFYDQPLAHPAIAEMVSTGLVSVTPLTASEVERAIAGPAEAVGVPVEPALVAALVSDVAGQPASLPLLQYALTELFEQRGDVGLQLASYEAYGGITGALAHRAEDLFARLSPPGQQAARQLFLRLVALGENGARDTRRRVNLAELGELGDGPEAMDAAISSFGARRLLTFDRDPLTRAPTVEVAHEALLREWERLREWIDAARDDVATHRRLAAATREWVEAAHDASVLLRGERLHRFEAWAERSGLALTSAERGFLTASVVRRDAEADDDRARVAHERALERRSLVRLRAVVAVVGLLALVTSVLSLVALDQRRTARHEADQARSRQVAATALTLLAQDPELSVLLALEAVEMTQRADGTVLREAEEALHRAVRGLRLVKTYDHGGSGVAVSADGTQLVTSSSSEGLQAVVLDAESGEQVAALADVGRGDAESVALSPDGRLVGSSNGQGPFTIWSARSGKVLRTLDGGGRVNHPAFSPDGRSVAAGDQVGVIRVWDVRDPTPRLRLQGNVGQVLDVAFSPDGTLLVSAGEEGSVQVWDLASGEIVTSVAAHEGGAFTVEFSPDGRLIASGGRDGAARLWQVRTGDEVATFAGPASVNDLALSRDGSLVATAGTDAVARVWEVGTGRELMHFAGHGRGGLSGVDFHPDGDRLLTTGKDNRTRLWDVTVGGSRDWVTVPGPRLSNVQVTFSNDGQQFATPAAQGGVSVRDTETGREVARLEAGRRHFTDIAFSPDGTRLVAGSDRAGASPVWDTRTGELLFALGGHTDASTAVAFDPAGERIVTLSTGAVWLWDATSGALLSELLGSPFPWWSGVAFSADGRYLAHLDEDRVVVRDAVTFAQLPTLPHRTNVYITHVAFAADDTVVAAHLDGSVVVLDLETGRERAVLRGHQGTVNQVAVSPDGATIASAGEDGSTRLWDLATGRELLRLYGHESPVSGVAFSGDGRFVATASPDGTVALHMLDVDELIDVARSRVGRGLTAEECLTYLQVSPCP